MHVHRLSMVMAMNVRQRHKKLRVRRKAALPCFPLPPLLAAGMAAGYVIGCCCGANAALPDSSGPVLSFLQSGGTGDTLYGGLLPELCISCAYGFAFLLLSTSYLGFLLIPVVFGVKGFLSACTAAAFLRSGCAHAGPGGGRAGGAGEGHQLRLPRHPQGGGCFCSACSARRCLCA